MPGRALDDEPPPVDALFADGHGQLDARARGNGHAAALRDHVVGLHGVELLTGEVARAVHTARLLVGHAEVDEGAARAEPALGEAPRGHRHGGGDVEHVGRPAPPHDAVLQLRGERIVLPSGGIGGHHVRVAHEHEGGRLGIAALDTREQADPPGRGSVALEGEPGAGEIGLESIGVALLVAGRRRAVVHAGVADEGAQKLRCFRLEALVVGHGISSSVRGGGDAGRAPPRPRQPGARSRRARAGCPG